MKIPVHTLEISSNGRTFWVHNDKGCTVLRVQCTGKIIIRRGTQNVCAHSDINVNGDIDFFVPQRVQKRTTKSKKPCPKKPSLNKR